MPRRLLVLSFLALLPGWHVAADGRTWTDSTGNYQVEADLIAFSETTVVLKKKDNSLVAVPVDKLSENDRGYLKSKEANELFRRSADAKQTWTLASGLEVVGKVVDFGRRDVTIQRRRGTIFVNDRRFDNLPEVYQKMLPKIVSHFEKTEIKDQRGLESWVMTLRGEPRTFTCEGVMLELENGDEYGVPFFLLSSGDVNILQPGWQRWLAAEKDRLQREHESFLLQSQAQAYQQDRLMNQQIAMMQLQMQGVQAGLTNLWEVRLIPGPGVMSPPLSVVVPGRDSRIATLEALRRNPGFVAGPVSRVSGRF
ncbi:MAG TPA: hypothetical protein DD670_16025 [Planctomycetaceae bacterium]|nr:hypothetical protein [Planctomycetaceae bacterium]